MARPRQNPQAKDIFNSSQPVAAPQPGLFFIFALAFASDIALDLALDFVVAFVVADL